MDTKLHILKNKKSKEQHLESQITPHQAQQIFAVTTIVQKQEEISEIVETQKRKLKQNQNLEKIKEKILLQKQQMMARKNKNKQIIENAQNGLSQKGDNIFMAAQQLNVQIIYKNVLKYK